MHALGRLREVNGRHAEAEGWYRREADVHDRAIAAGSYFPGWALDDLAKLYGEQNRPEEAQALG